ncbi:hypothetical protein RJ492_001200 [Pluralibacter gergoviae]|uniref:Uncharacterized protein n=1 Tax=Pluralibacter gergoviae TaxID=61647 RepID=A0AAI9DKV0_PLUGE|nr:hypothetical protein [Pluralibacter gergoviae]EKV9907717.1 hypothetical protein [Pluralibacter gergoviae]EKW7276814.1 hypothetical protein [Pluralibacter gergoviae]ELD4293951.1 hypothetical protein [Pluralibacter gergoviae]ELD4304730.1 hypothetical protein [Pluralibacter gergoviae]
MAFGNALDMCGHVDSTFTSKLPGGVALVRFPAGGYAGPGGTWQDAAPVRTPLMLVNVQPAKWKDFQLLLGMGGTTNPQDARVVHINDGVTYLYPDDDGKFSDILEFTDGIAVQQWRVMSCDNRPWRNFCRAVVERYRRRG